MHNALQLFRRNIGDVRNLEGLHATLTATVLSPLSYDDLLRSQVVYAVSAFDKLMHDLIRIGMTQIFIGSRPATPKYLAEPISLELFGNLTSAAVAPSQTIFEQALFRKFKIASFQEPSKVADGLSYIWPEAQKWQKISLSMGVDESLAKTTLKLIADRRNIIVHESDIDPVTNQKFLIDQAMCKDMTNFLERCGNAIASLV